MGGKSQPDYGDIAASQAEDNRRSVRDQTYANRPTQYTPFGYTQWTSEQVIDPATGEPTSQWSQTQGLTPELQEILNKQIAIQGGRTDIAGALTNRLGQEFGSPTDWRGLSPMGTNPTEQYTIPEPDIGSPYATRQAAEDAVYNQAMSRIQPKFDEQKRAMEVRMRNQGLSPQDQAWQTQMEGIGQNENDAVNQAVWSANQAGLAESGQMYGQLMGRNQNQFNQAYGANQANFNQAMQSSQYANQIRQQQITEALTKRGASLNEINALLAGGQVNTPQMPSFSASAAATPAPTYQAAVDEGNADAVNRQATWGGIGDVLGAATDAYGAYKQ